MKRMQNVVYIAGLRTGNALIGHHPTIGTKPAVQVLNNTVDGIGFEELLLN